MRGGFGIFYDRPQGNLVFDLITNPPGLSALQLTSGRFLAIDPEASVHLNAPIALYPTQHEWELPKVYGWNVGVQARLPLALVLDVAYVGSDSRNQAQAIPRNAVPYGDAFAREPGPDAAVQPHARQDRPARGLPAAGTARSACTSTRRSRTATRCRPGSTAGSTAG